MFLVSVVCCQVEVSTTGRSLVQRSPNECDVSECDVSEYVSDCDVSECDLEISTMKPRPTKSSH